MVDTQNDSAPKDLESNAPGQADFARIVLALQARDCGVIRRFWASIDDERRRQVLGYRDSLGESVLSCSVEADACDSVQLFVEAGANLEARAKHGCTPLYTAAAARWGAQIVRYLVEKGANKDFVAPSRRSVLMAALDSGDPEVALYLLDQGATVSNALVERDGATAAIQAIRSDNLPVFFRLCELGLYAGKEEFVLGQAVGCGAVGIVEACLQDPVLALPAAGRGLNDLVVQCASEGVRQRLLSHAAGRLIDSTINSLPGAEPARVASQTSGLAL